jgi:acyl transferase domain-containing protein
MDDGQTNETGLEVAIIGMAGRFPGAPDLAAFWDLLQGGVEAISFFSLQELTAAGVDPALLADPRFVAARGVLASADLFDADFFGYSPREAEAMDPQQRVFLECAWEALENAGCDPASFPGLAGIWGGVAMNSYFLNLLSQPGLIAALGPQQISLGNDKDFLCTRAAYKLGLEGPALTVQTACSSSLVAVHAACQALLGGECDLALAGGVSVGFPQVSGYLYQENGILSPDGHCRTFDARARGSVSGQGVGLVVLKRLEKAREDGDTIRAVIKGSAVNNDGSAKAGFTAPRVDGQAKVVRAAHLTAEVEAATISFVETHGTGTELGDPIEVAALTQAFRAATGDQGFCALGSVKTNIGHLDAAAGIAGLIKTVLALEHRTLPATLHFEAPNPQIELEGSPFYVQARRSSWPRLGGPRRAGVSSFGLGGTNAHVVLEEAPALAPSDPPARPWQLLLLSARTESALEAATDRLADHLRGADSSELADLAFTGQTGRRAFRHRRALVARDRTEAAEVLAGRGPGRLMTAALPAEPAQVAFVFSGLGDHYAGMGRGLYRSEPVFRAAIDRCAELLAPELGLDLRQVLYPPAAEPEAPAVQGAGLDLRALLRGPAPAADEPLQRTELAQPALFAVEHALACLWESWGARPRAGLGYSLGEYSAACQAGVLSLADALALVARRARLIQWLPPGAMLAVSLSEAEVVPWLNPALALAAVNGPTLSVVSGPVEAVAALARRLTEAGTVCRPLRTTHAFHSPEMASLAAPFRELVRSFELRPPAIPYLSNVTGTWIRDEEATDPDYWVAHLLRPVRFARGIAELLRLPGRTLLEIGPGRSLGSLAVQLAQGAGEGPIALPTVSSLRHEHDRQDDQAFALRGLGQLWLAGVNPDWAALHSGDRRRRVPLPSYPFERRRFFVERSDRQLTPDAAPSRAAAKLQDLADWFHLPSWKRTLPPPAPGADAGPDPWLLLADEHGVGERLAERLRAAGREVVLAGAGAALAHPGGFDALLGRLSAPPAKIVHLWSLSTSESVDSTSFARRQETGFYALLDLAQALGRLPSQEGARTEICIVANGLCRIESGDPLHPGKATLLGPVRVLPQEQAGLACRAIDVDLGALTAHTPGAPATLDALLRELESGAAEPLVAWRGRHRWAQAFEPIRLEGLESAPDAVPPYRAGGVYLITGGTGGIGLALAGHLARTAGARLVLVGRSPHRRTREVEALEAAGAEVLALSADVTDAARMQEVVWLAVERFGRIDGVFHVAGLPGAGLAQVKSHAMAREVLAAKTEGTLALAAALEGLPLDFVVLFSSIAALAGGIGQVDYSAANSFLGSWSQAFTERSGIPAVAIDWCEWQWDAWTGSILGEGSLLRTELDRQRQLFGLTFEEGMEALRRILASGAPEVVVSTRPLAEVLVQHSLQELLRDLAGQPARREGREERQEKLHARPALVSSYIAPRDETERCLAGIWEGLLGVAGIGIHDDFFELGGHSLLGLQALARIEESFAVRIPLHALFVSPTVAELAPLITAPRGPGAPGDNAGRRLPDLVAAVRPDPRELLQSLDALSDSEMDALLAEMAQEEELLS